MSVVSVVRCQLEVLAMGRSRGVLPSEVCLSVILRSKQRGGLDRRGCRGIKIFFAVTLHPDKHPLN